MTALGARDEEEPEADFPVSDAEDQVSDEDEIMAMMEEEEDEAMVEEEEDTVLADNEAAEEAEEKEAVKSKVSFQVRDGLWVNWGQGGQMGYECHSHPPACFHHSFHPDTFFNSTESFWCQ